MNLETNTAEVCHEAAIAEPRTIHTIDIQGYHPAIFLTADLVTQFPQVEVLKNGDGHQPKGYAPHYWFIIEIPESLETEVAKMVKGYGGKLTYLNCRLRHPRS